MLLLVGASIEGMTPSNWLYLLSTVVAIVSVFLSNYLGRKASESNFKRDQLEKRYLNFYVPIIRKMYTFNPVLFKKRGLAGNMPFIKIVDEPVPEDFQDLFGKSEPKEINWIVEFIRENIQYATPALLEIYYEQFELRTKSPMYDHSLRPQTPEYRESLETFNALKYDFNKKLILQILEESQTISSTLKLPNISKPLFDVWK